MAASSREDRDRRKLLREQTKTAKALAQLAKDQRRQMRREAARDAPRDADAS